MFGQPFLKPSAGRPLPSYLGKFIELIETTVSPALKGDELPIANLVRRFEHLNTVVCFFEAIYFHDHDLATLFSPFDIAEGSFCCLLSLRDRFLVAPKLKWHWLKLMQARALVLSSPCRHSAWHLESMGAIAIRVVHIVYPCELLLYLQAQGLLALPIGDD